MHNKRNVIRVIIEPDEIAQLQADADIRGLSLAGLLRASVGLKPMDRGGARNGSGRPPKPRAPIYKNRVSDLDGATKPF
jgi:hypothetical protein